MALRKVKVKAKKGTTCKLAGLKEPIGDKTAVEVDLTVDVHRLINDGSLVRETAPEEVKPEEVKPPETKTASPAQTKKEDK